MERESGEKKKLELNRATIRRKMSTAYEIRMNMKGFYFEALNLKYWKSHLFTSGKRKKKWAECSSKQMNQLKNGLHSMHGMTI